MKTVALVCGGRDYANAERVNAVLDELAPDLVIHGAARGADSLAGAWARSRGIPAIDFPANWHIHGKRAGMVRNQSMADALGVARKNRHGTVIVAFPGGRGTAHMVSTGFANQFRVVTCDDLTCNG